MKRIALLAIPVGLLLVLAAVLFYIRPWDAESAVGPIDWDLTIVGSDGQEVTLSYQELVDLPYYVGRGGCFSSVGVVSGPFDIRGVPVPELCDLVGGVDTGDIVFISAVDGYSAVFDYSQVHGAFDTFDPETLGTVPHDKLKLVLMYEQDGRPLDHEYGRPLRLATAGTDEVLTEGHYWVKWVNRIEIIHIG